MTKWKQADIDRGALKNSENYKPLKIGIGANALTKHALKVLNLKGYHVWRQNNGGVYDPIKKCFRANSATPGISDIIGFNRKTGQFLACEIKAGKDKLSKEQELFLKWVKDSGGVSLVIRTMDDIENLLKIEKWEK